MTAKLVVIGNTLIRHVTLLASKKWYMLLYLIILGIICYLPSFSGDLFWDDNDFIVDNVYVKQTQLHKFFLYQAVEGSDKPSNYFRPIQFSLYALIYKAFETQPFPYHAASIGIHIAASFTVFLFIYTFIIQFPFYTASLKKSIAALIAVVLSTLFLLHPIQTEAVSYVSGVSDPLVAFFGFLTLYFFLTAPPKNLPIAAVGLYILTLLSKESGVIFGGILFLVWVINTYYSQKKHRTINIILHSFIWKVLPFFLLSCAYLIYHIRVIQTVDMMRIWGDHPYTHSLMLRIVTFLHILPDYLSVSLFPKTLYYDRDFSIVIPNSPWHFPSFFILSIIITLGIIVLVQTKQHHSWILSLFFFLSFFVAFLPFSGILLINGLMYEHFLYIPLVFLFGWILSTLLLLTYKRYAHFTLSILCLLLILAIPMYIMRSWNRQYEWNNAIRFYTQTLQHVPQSFRVRNNLATEYQRLGQYDKAKEEYMHVIKLNPRLPNGYHNLANLFIEEKNYQEAETYFYKALDVDPNFGYSYQGLLRLYTETGNSQKQVKIQEKINQLLQTVAL